MNELEGKLDNPAEDRDKIRQQITITTVLFVASWAVSAVGYFIFHHFYWLYQHTHIAGVSYLLVGQLVFWIAHAVYLSESLTIEQNLYSPDKKKGGLASWLRKQIKTM